MIWNTLDAMDGDTAISIRTVLLHVQKSYLTATLATLAFDSWKKTKKIWVNWCIKSRWWQFVYNNTVKLSTYTRIIEHIHSINSIRFFIKQKPTLKNQLKTNSHLIDGEINECMPLILVCSVHWRAYTMHNGWRVFFAACMTAPLLETVPTANGVPFLWLLSNYNHYSVFFHCVDSKWILLINMAFQLLSKALFSHSLWCPKLELVCENNLSFGSLIFL